MNEPFDPATKRVISIDPQFHGRMRCQLRPGLGVVECAFLTRISSESLVSPGASGIMLVIDNPHGSPHNGEVLGAGDLVIYGPGAHHSEHGRGQVTLQLGLRALELDRQLRALLGEDAPELEGRRYRIRLRPSAAQRLEAVMRRSLEAPRAEPAPATSSGGLSGDAQDLVSTVCEIVAAEFPCRADVPTSRDGRERLFLAATDALQGGNGVDDLTSLCERMGVGAETLRLVFREFVGVPPMRWAKLRRMHECRRLLKTANPQVDNVKSVALRSGVRHLGRFSVEYRRLFGEHPSETLRAG